jgi:hypothetical protein
MPDPYVAKDENAMDMIRHHDECIERDVREMVRDFIPAGGNQVASLVKYAPAVTSAYGYEVCAWRRIIKAPEAY